MNKKINREPSALGKLLAFSLACLIPKGALADSLTLTTWYPAPYGVYSQLRSTGNSYLAYQSGNVGIGTSSPQAKLDVVGILRNGAGVSDYIESNVGSGPRINFGTASNSSQYLSFGAYNTTNNIDTKDRQLRIFSASDPVGITYDPSGNVGIGTTNPAARLDVKSDQTNGATMAKIVGYGGNLGTNNTVLDLGANVASSGNDTVLRLTHTNIDAQGGYGYLMYGTAGIGSLHRDAMIDLHGNMGLGSNGNVGPGNGLMYRLQLFNCPGGGGDAQWGCAAKADGTTWINASDARLKDIQGDYRRGLSEIAQLQPVRFRYKKGNPLGLPSEKEIIGFTAQQVQKTVPEAVFEGPDGYLRFNADPVFWAMLNAVKELNDKVRRLEEEVKTLKERGKSGGGS